MEVASSSSATGKNSRLEFSPDWNLAIARFRSPLALHKCTGSNDSVSHYTRPDAHTRKPRSGVRGWRLRHSTSTTPRGCVHKEAQKRPSGAPYRAGSRPSGPTRPRQRHSRLGRSCLRVLPRAGARPLGTRSPRGCPKFHRPGWSRGYPRSRSRPRGVRRCHRAPCPRRSARS